MKTIPFQFSFIPFNPLQKIRLLPSLMVAFVVSFSWGSTDTQAPNLIVIFCDDLGYGDLACYGHPSIATPHIDRMAAEGQKWTQFYVGASVCTPSRAALMTGRLPNRSGMMSSVNGVLFPDSTGGLPADEWTLAELLKTQGYHTAAIGKWHLGHHEQFLPTHNGFDVYWGIPYSNDMNNLEEWGHYRRLAESDAHYEAPQGQYDVPIFDGTEEIERPAQQRTLTERYNQKAIEWIRQYREEPFFIYLAHNMVHVPLYAGDAFRGKSLRGAYGDTIEEIDAGVGEILDELRQLGLAEKTLVVFTSDNGPWLLYRSHGGSPGMLQQGKGTTYEGGMRVPAIFWQPGVVAPGVQRCLGTTMDLLPTMCEMAGIDLPKDRVLDGESLVRVLKGSPEQCSSLPTETTGRCIYYWRANELYAIRQGPWKLHFITEGSYGIGAEKLVHTPPLLFQLDQDPGEQWDLAAKHPDIVATLTALAEAHQLTIEPVKDQLAERVPQ